MASADFTVEGLRALDQRLKKLPEQLRRKPVKKALDAGKRFMVAEAKANLDASSEGKGSGLLRRNIKGRANRQRKRDRVSVDVGVQAGTKKQIAGGNDPWYWRFQEKGFTATGRRKLKGGNLRRLRARVAGIKSGAFTWIEGRQFLGDALFRNEGRIVELFRSELASDIRKREVTGK